MGKKSEQEVLLINDIGYVSARKNDGRALCIVLGYISAAVLLALSVTCVITLICVEDNQVNLACNNTNCRVMIVESIPENLTYSAGSPSFMSTYDAWMQLIDSACKQIDIVAFYWTLRGSDTGSNDPSDRQGELVFQKLLRAVKEKKITLRIINNDSKKKDNEIAELIQAGADVRFINFEDLFNGGVLHTKMWLVDGMSVYIGSANMDWRSLTQVKELGAVISSCPCLVDDASKLFDVYWYLGQPNTPIPRQWPSKYSTKFNAHSPMNVQLNSSDSRVFMSSSPGPFCPQGRTSDIDAILDVIDKAEKFIHISVMDYLPSVIYTYPKPKRFWPVIDDALRKVSLEKGIKVRLLISKWNDTKPDMFKYLRSLADISGALKAHIEVRLFIVPTFTKAQAKIPFARVNHNKYMVTDNVAYIGTSNWSGDYFESTAGVGLIINQTSGQHQVQSVDTEQNTVQKELADIFDRDWNSVYAHALSEFIDDGVHKL